MYEISTLSPESLHNLRYQTLKAPAFIWKGMLPRRLPGTHHKILPGNWSQEFVFEDIWQDPGYTPVGVKVGYGEL